MIEILTPYPEKSKALFILHHHLQTQRHVRFGGAAIIEYQALSHQNKVSCLPGDD